MYANELALKKVQPQGLEVRLAEDYVSLLDYLSRFQHGIEEGNWYYVRDKMLDLMSGPGERLVNALSVLPTGDEEHGEIRAFKEPAADGARVLALAQVWAQTYAAGRTLHPAADITDTQLREQVERENERRGGER